MAGRDPDALAVGLYEALDEAYREGGVQTVELGSVAFAHADPITGRVMRPPLELVRLAIPLWVYTQTHLDFVIKTLEEIAKRKHLIRGVQIVREPELLRHFSAESAAR